MAQSLAVLYVHIVFSTKGRHPFLQDGSFRSEAHTYLGGTSAHLGCPPLVVGGTKDHVHILARQAKNVALSDWIRDLKSNSSTWIKEQRPAISRFAWQAGYGAFSVDMTRIEVVRNYILGQEAHHKKVTFQDELRRILIEHGIEPDEAHLWD